MSRAWEAWAGAGVVSAAQTAGRTARWSAPARAWLRVWVADCCWPSRSSTPASTVTGSAVLAAAGSAGPPGGGGAAVGGARGAAGGGAAVVAGGVGGRARAGGRVGGLGRLGEHVGEVDVGAAAQRDVGVL